MGSAVNIDMVLDIKSPDFWRREALDKELRRVSDICNGCRRCYNLCPSFNSLFQSLDSPEIDGDAEKLRPVQLKQMIDLCYQCKLCFNHCPYTPPHRWAIDFPRLMLRAKAVEARERGISLQDRFLSSPDSVGKIASLFAPLVNRLNRARLNRFLLEKIFGIHRERNLPPYRFRTFARWQRRRARSLTPARTRGGVVLFYTCLINHNYPEIGRAAVSILERNDLQALCPAQVCCGMPYLDAGDIDSAFENARYNARSIARYIDRGCEVVVLGATCGYVLKQEYPLLLEGDEGRKLSASSFDFAEFLMRLHRAGRLSTDFTAGLGRVLYQIPCHLRAQNIGYKTLELLRLVPNTQVELVEACSGVDGTWGFKREYFELSLGVAGRLVGAIKRASPDLVVTDCPMSALQIEKAAGVRPLHPAQALALAYGLRP